MSSNVLENSQPPAIDTADNLLIEFVKDRDAHCPLCHYNVRNLQTPRCPECGQPLRLAIATTESLLKPWLLLLLPLVASGGIGVFFTLAILAEGLPPPFFRPTAFGYIACIPASLVALRTRRKFLTVAQSTRRVITFISIAFCAALAVSFVVIVVMHR